METVPAAKAAKGFGAILHRANRGKVTIVTRSGLPVAAVVPVSDKGDPIVPGVRHAAGFHAFRRGEPFNQRESAEWKDGWNYARELAEIEKGGAK